jgi:hypothetical protein
MAWKGIVLVWMTVAPVVMMLYFVSRHSPLPCHGYTIHSGHRQQLVEQQVKEEGEILVTNTTIL